MSESTGTSFDREAAAAAGVTVDEEVFADYWGFSDTKNHFLPDGRQYFVIQRMNEGAKAKYQREIRSDITIQRSTGDAKMKADPATERHALLKACVVGWNLKAKDERAGTVIDVPFSISSGQYNFEKWLSVADPRWVEELEKECRKLNPWLLQELSVEDIDKEIENLKEMREAAAKREAGE